MKKFFLILGVIVALIIAAALVIPMFINPNNYKAEIVKAVKDKSGYKLKIDGDIKVSAFPTAKAIIKNVSVSTGNNQPFVQLKELQAYMKVKPLLDDKIEVSEIKLVEPKLSLIQKGSSNNWTAKKPAKAPKEEAPSSSASKHYDLEVNDFTIVDGDVSFNNNGNDLKVEKLNLTASYIGNNLDIKKFAADIFGGKINANGMVRLGVTPETSLKFEGKNFDLAQIAEGFLRNKRVERGTANFSGDIKASGMTPDKIFATLNGSGKIDATKLAIRGFDLGEFSESIQRMKNPAELINLVNSFKGDNKSSKINSIAGDFTVKNGLVTLPGVKVEADYAQGVYAGTINLPASVMNTEAKLNLLSIDKSATPKVGLRITGATSNPQLSADLTDLSKWALKKYGGGVLNNIPDKYQGFLKGL